MAQLLIRNVPDETIDAWKAKAKINGHSLEQELRNLLEANKPYTPEERLAVALKYQSMMATPVKSLTLDEIRDGLE